MSESSVHIQTSPDDGAIDLRALGRRVAARKWWILVPSLLAFAGMLAFVNTVKPRYTADAKVFLDSQESFYTRPDKTDVASPEKLDPEAVMSQVQLVSSRELAREAIQKLNLAGDPEFDPMAMRFGVLDRVMAMMGLSRVPATSEEGILEKFSDKLLVFQVPKTRVLQIEFSSQKPELAARAANVVADLYIKKRSDAKKGDTLKARDWLAETVRTLKPKVEQANLAVARFREEHGLQRGAGDRSTVSQELGELVTKLADARSQQSDAQAKSAMIRRMLRSGRIMDIPDVAKDELIRRIAEQRVNLRSQLALELRTLLPGHPRVKELQSQVDALDSELRQAADKVARTLDNDASLAAQRIKFLDAEVARRRQAVGESGEKDAQLKMLEQEAATLDAQLQSALAKYNDANARDFADSTPPDVRLVSPATAPILPTFPKKIPMLLLSLLGGLILSSGVVVTRELLSAPQRAAVRPALPAELAHETNLPVAARMAAAGSFAASDIGAPPSPRERHADETPDDAASFDEICAALVAMGEEGRASRILVTGLRETIGAQAAVRLARTLSRRGRAILVDLTTLGGPTQMLELDLCAGLGELIDGDVSFAEAIHRDQATRLHVLPAGRSIAEGEAPDEGLVADALAALSATYDHVVIAAPESARALDLKGLTGQIDLIALVAALAEERAQARQSRDTLSASGVETLIVDAARAGRGGSDRDAA
jgi:uncharacterized protein involved in exopolysaccharide biosynthesis